MEHPKLFGAGDPTVARVRRLCLAFPEAVEKEAWGRPTFRASSKIFVTLGSSMDRPYSVIVKPDPEERPALLQDPRFFVPPYFGPAGWLALDVGDDTDWMFLAELVDASYRQVALRRQVAALDAFGVHPSLLPER